MITIFLLDPPLDRRVVDAVHFPARVTDASSIEPGGPAHLIVCRNRPDVLSRLEAWLTEHGYREREGGGLYDAPMGISWQRWERRAR